ncbi:PQQ-dependent sugar dehydrogenase [Janthinobacterium psychrotolerans]|uniref:Glucose/arabinose dehydrogenase, beta-propeller fold n=1 Tax=Janthinobacterium psychrotolerans TaxID=1747903 RepID=A0A1A7BWM2_9BURK|nr:PQQ-dependent sugar dehydrogenase [Janthinobacterium psychrotolerans]OBV36910.1 Glucose/arabinose dehydrogenase, beta-propeller fold [Janthinobacterium psychrotolerans]
MSHFRSVRATAIAAAMLALSLPAHAELAASGEPPAAKQAWRAVTVAEGVRQPWGMAWLGDGRALVTSKQGTLHILNGQTFDEVALDGMPKIFTGGQGGLLDIALHPSDANKANPRVYMTVSTGTSEANRTTLVQGVFDGQKVAGIKTLFQVSTDKSGGQHFGSRLLWLPDGTLLMSVADGGNPPLRIGDRLAREQAQNPATHLGAILRLTDEGKPAPGNPLAAKGALPEIWSMGHRNIQGLARDPVSGRIWATEHGPYGGDELNLVVAGGNYGWPLQSYGADYKTHAPVGKHAVAGMINPSVAWVPSPAPSGLAVYSGDKIPAWRGSVFSGGLAARDIRRVAVDAAGQVTGQDRLAIGERVRDVKQGPDGYLYALTDESNGKLLRIVAQ